MISMIFFIITIIASVIIFISIYLFFKLTSELTSNIKNSNWWKKNTLEIINNYYFNIIYKTIRNT